MTPLGVVKYIRSTSYKEGRSAYIRVILRRSTWYLRFFFELDQR